MVLEMVLNRRAFRAKRLSTRRKELIEGKIDGKTSSNHDVQWWREYDGFEVTRLARDLCHRRKLEERWTGNYTHHFWSTISPTADAILNEGKDQSSFGSRANGGNFSSSINTSRWSWNSPRYSIRRTRHGLFSYGEELVCLLMKQNSVSAISVGIEDIFLRIIFN